MFLQDYFFLVFLITILVIRIIVYFFPVSSPTLKGFRFHHYMYGLIMIPIGIIFESLMIYAIGLGFFVDELGYLLIRGKSHKDNYSKWSLILLGFFIVLVYILRRKLFFF